MAGHRRGDGSGRDRAIVVRTRRRTTAFRQRLALARTPAEQVHVAAEHARGLLTLLAGEPEIAVVADDIIRAIDAGCDQAITAAIKRRRAAA